MSIPLKQIFNISLTKTLRMNFYYLPFREAIKIPIIVSRKVKIRLLKGAVNFNCRIETGLVKIGFDTLGTIDYKHNRAIWENDGTITFNGPVRIGASTKLVLLKGSSVIFGSKVSITGSSNIIAEKECSIGDCCLISWDCQIMDTDFHKIYNDSGKRINNPKSIIIGNNVWIGSKVLILKGAEIPNNCIIAANSTVVKRYTEENAIYGGQPATLLKRNIKWTI